MGAPEYKIKSNIPEVRIHRVSITGTGAAPTLRAGPGITVTRTAPGVYRFAFAYNPGTFVGIAGHTFRADAPANVKGFTISGGVYVAPTSGAAGYIEVAVFDAAQAAADLAAAAYLDLTFVFAAQSVIK